MTEQTSPDAAIEAIYGQYANDVYRYAWMTLGDANEACDVVQEVFLRAYRSWNTYRQAASTKTWLMTIARNYISDLLRKRRTARKYLSNVKVEPINEDAGRTDAIAEVVDAVAQLKHSYRQVITLRYIDSLSVRETATILGWTETKVKMTTHRALEQLRRIFETDPGVTEQ